MTQNRQCTIILQSVLRYKKITRGQLCSILKISPGAIVKYIKILIDTGILRESSSTETSGAGRKAAYLEFNPEKGVIAAFALDRTKIEAGIITTTGEILSRRKYPYDENSTKEELLAKLFPIIQLTLEEISHKGMKPIGIGISMGGQLDADKGISHEYLFAKNWYSVPIGTLVKEKFQLPTYLVKDTNACVLGEQYFGEGIGVDNFLSVWIGTGIGMGIVIGGSNYTGASGYAGELGHTKGGDPTRLCYCGRMGCLETSASEEYILGKCREGLNAGVMSSMKRFCGDDGDNLTIEHAIAAANDRDRLACGVFAEAGERIGMALCDVANIFNPELIIFRGPLIDGNEFLFDAIKRTVLDHALKQIAKNLDMRFAGQDAGVQLKGLCSLVLNGLIDDSGFDGKSVLI